MDIDLTIPDFLLREPVKEAIRDRVVVHTKWVMPDITVYKTKRDSIQRRTDVLKDVRAIMKHSSYTLTKIRTLLLESGAEYEDREIQSALRQLTKQRLVVLRKRTWHWVGDRT